MRQSEGGADTLVYLPGREMLKVLDNKGKDN